MELSDKDADYARRIASRFRPTGILDVGDYEAIAMLAAWKATKTYQPGRGASFTTWAHHCITGDIGHAIRDQSGVSCKAWDRGERLDIGAMPDGYDAPDTRPGPEDITLSDIGAVEILRVVATYPTGQRQAFRAAVRGDEMGAHGRMLLRNVRRKVRRTLEAS